MALGRWAAASAGEYRLESFKRGERGGVVSVYVPDATSFVNLE